MAKIRQLFNHVDVETAKRQRLCHHNRTKHSISQGERCLVIKQSDGARKNYCVGCATDILDRAENDLAELRAKISSAK